MAARSEHVEILVHINAPGRVADDAHYRELAESYLDFQPCRTTALPTLEEDERPCHEDRNREDSSMHSIPSDSRIPAPVSPSQEHAMPAPTALILDSQDLSFQSALDNRESPRLGDTTVGFTANVASSPVNQRDGNGDDDAQKQWHAPPSEVEDSYPMPDPSLLRVSPSKVLERYLRSSTSRPDKLIPGSPSPLAPGISLSVPREHAEIPSSPVRRSFEGPSSPAESLPPLTTIPSSPPLPPQRPGAVSLSPDDEEAELSLVKTSQDPPNRRPRVRSPIADSALQAVPLGGASQPKSDDILDVTHITGSSVEGEVDEPEKQEAVFPAKLQALGDPLEVTHITSSSILDLSAAPHLPQKQVPPLTSDTYLDFTHISMSSTDDSPGAAPSQRRGLPSETIDSLQATRISSSSFETGSISQPKANVSVSSKELGSQSSGSSPSPVTSSGTHDILTANAQFPAQDDVQALNSSPLEIMPPSPPAGLHTVLPDDLIPPQLSKLSSDLSSRYRPSPPGRTLDPLERGHWLLHCGSWPPTARDSTWQFLRRYVESGLAGWGLWCRRSEEPHDHLKLYCWGHVVKHAYLLLYLASERRLKATGARWIDADGEVVVEVAPCVR